MNTRQSHLNRTVALLSSARYCSAQVRYAVPEQRPRGEGYDEL